MIDWSLLCVCLEFLSASGAVVGDELPGYTFIGGNNIIGHHAVVGVKCQDLKYKVCRDVILSPVIVLITRNWYLSRTNAVFFFSMEMNAFFALVTTMKLGSSARFTGHQNPVIKRYVAGHCLISLKFQEVVACFWVMIITRTGYWWQQSNHGFLSYRPWL